MDPIIVFDELDKVSENNADIIGSLMHIIDSVKISILQIDIWEDRS